MNVKVPATRLEEILKEWSTKLSHLEAIEVLTAGIMLGRNLNNSNTIISEITKLHKLSNKLELSSKKKAIMWVNALDSFIKEINENPFKSSRGAYCYKLKRRVDKKARKNALKYAEERPVILKEVVHSDAVVSHQPSAWAKNGAFIRSKKRRSYIQTRNKSKSNWSSPRKGDSLIFNDRDCSIKASSDDVQIDLSESENSWYTYSPMVYTNFETETQNCISDSDDNLWWDICDKFIFDTKFQNTNCGHLFHKDCIRIYLQPRIIGSKISAKWPVRRCKVQIWLSLKRTIIESINSFKKGWFEFISSVDINKINILWWQNWKYIFSAKKIKFQTWPHCSNRWSTLESTLNIVNSARFKTTKKHEQEEMNRIHWNAYQSWVSQLERCTFWRKWKQSITDWEILKCKWNTCNTIKN